MLDQKKISVHYLKFWFSVDLIAVLPLDAVARAAGYTPTTPGNLLGILKLPRLLRLAKILKQIDLSSANLLRLVWLISGFLMLVHWIACIWYFLGVIQSEGNIFTDRPWPYTYFLKGNKCHELGWQNLLDKTPWESTFDLEWQFCTYNSTEMVIPGAISTGFEGYAFNSSRTMDANLRTKYSTAMYWAMTTLTTVGYGDISPQTTSERLFVIAAMLAGAVIYAVLFGNIGLVINKLDYQNYRYSEKLDSINELIRFHEVHIYIYIYIVRKLVLNNLLSLDFW